MSGEVRTADELRRDPRFVEYVALFNEGKFFAAHEALEALWLEVAGEEREFLQGLVQVAVALEHRARGNRAGAARVLARARRRLRGYGARHGGLALEAILGGAEAFLAGTRADPPHLPAVPRREVRRALNGKGAGIGKEDARKRKPMRAKSKAMKKKTAVMTGAKARAKNAKKKGSSPKPRAIAAAVRHKPARRAAGMTKGIRGAKRSTPVKRAAPGRAPSGVKRAVPGARPSARPSPRGSARRLEPLEVRRARALAILEGLRRLYPDAHCELDHGSALELLVATILSAQCTDVRVNMTTPALFARYRTAHDYAGASLEEVGEIVRSTGFYRNKAKSIVALGKALVERHGGEVPVTMDELVELPGVGRKTANVLLAEWFHQPGIAVDTHVIRLTGPVWRLTHETDPVKIEFALYELIPEQDRAFFGIATIFHGRRICSARRPDCAGCALNVICPSAFALARVRPAV